MSFAVSYMFDHSRGSNESSVSDSTSAGSSPRTVKVPRQRRRAPGMMVDGKIESKNVTAACQFCRRLRRKCEGGNPCNNCVRSKSQCVFDKQPDRRHREYKEKVATELNERADMYDALIQAIRVTDEGDLIKLIHDVKDGKDDAVQQLVHRAHDANPDATTESRAPPIQRPTHNDQQLQLPRGKRKRCMYDDELARQDGLLGSEQSSTPALSGTSDISSPEQSTYGSPSKAPTSWPRYGFKGSVEGFGNLPLSSAVKANNYPLDVQKSQLMYFEQPEHLTPSLLIHSQNGPQIGNLYAKFFNAARNLLQEGVSTQQVIGYGSIDVSLLFRKKTSSDFLSANTFACDIARLLLLRQIGTLDCPDVLSYLESGTVSADTEQTLIVALALISGLTRLTRWSLLPTSKLYAQIPEMSRPLPAQRLIPHSPDIDLCVHPVSRRCLINRYRDISRVTELPGCGASVNWPHGLKQALDFDAASGQILVTRDFEAFAAQPDNWSWSPRILEIFPEAEEMGAIIIREPANSQLIDKSNTVRPSDRPSPNISSRPDEPQHRWPSAMGHIVQHESWKPEKLE